VRELLKLGLTVQASNGGSGIKSSNYGVFSRGPDGHTRGFRSGGCGRAPIRRTRLRAMFRAAHRTDRIFANSGLCE
jgi:hypothetical protein